jgi:hypothetical protein
MLRELFRAALGARKLGLSGFAVRHFKIPFRLRRHQASSPPKPRSGTLAIKTSEFLDGDVDQPAGIGIFIAAHRLGRFEVLHAAQRFGTRLTVAGDTRRAMGFPGNR